MPVFNPGAPGWIKGYRLMGVRTQETSAKGSLVPESLQLRAGPDAESALLYPGVDYQVDAEWGTLGWATHETPQTERTAFASYTYGQSRIDSIVIGADRGIVIREGTPHVTVPTPPKLNGGETLLANVWLSVRLPKLTPESLFPVLEPCYPVAPAPNPVPAAELIPKAYAKLMDGVPITILAWGDSVTDGSYLQTPSTERWQEQFVARLRAKFTKARITLVTEAWGGRNTGSYRAEPPGSLHNYKEKVLAVKPDLIISEFVNDGGLTAEETHERYGVILQEFKDIGAEWIILTPHYILPEWMGSQGHRDIDEDPRGYVRGLRAFAAANHVALADASLRWGRLWRQGVPYMTLMMNAINHPNPCGMRIFSDSLMELF
jgi:lysophospholipase L1-like esterase